MIYWEKQENLAKNQQLGTYNRLELIVTAHFLNPACEILPNIHIQIPPFQLKIQRLSQAVNLRDGSLL